MTVNPTNEFIKKNLLNNFDYIQLHGSETNDRVNEIKNMGIKVIKTIKIKEEKDIELYKNFISADIILFDTPGMEKSIKFPKELISKLPIGEKYALAGSINKDNIENISIFDCNFF